MLPCFWGLPSCHAPCRNTCMAHALCSVAAGSWRAEHAACVRAGLVPVLGAPQAGNSSEGLLAEAVAVALRRGLVQPKQHVVCIQSQHGDLMLKVVSVDDAGRGIGASAADWGAPVLWLGQCYAEASQYSPIKLARRQQEYLMQQVPHSVGVWTYNGVPPWPSMTYPVIHQRGVYNIYATVQIIASYRTAAACCIEWHDEGSSLRPRSIDSTLMGARSVRGARPWHLPTQGLPPTWWPNATSRRPDRTA